MFCDFATAGAKVGRTAAVRPLAGEGMIGWAMGPKGDVFTARSFTVRQHRGNPSVTAPRGTVLSQGRNVSHRSTLLGLGVELPPGFEDEI